MKLCLLLFSQRNGVVKSCVFPLGIYFFKVNNRSTVAKSEIYSKLKKNKDIRRSHCYVHTFYVSYFEHATPGSSEKKSQHTRYSRSEQDPPCLFTRINFVWRINSASKTGI